MLTVSILTNYINVFNEIEFLRESLDTWIDQTHPAIEILLADSSKPGPEQEAVVSLCKDKGIIFTRFPFNYYTSYAATAMNKIASMAKGDAILWFCPMWRLKERTWIERMAKRLEFYGPNTIVATDNDRRKLRSCTTKATWDWFAGYPDIFPSPHYAYIDNPKMMFYRSAWIPMDTDFDPPPDNFPQIASNAHGLIYWGYQQVHTYKRTIILCRDFQMEHAPHRVFPGDPEAQAMSTVKVMVKKGVRP